MPESADSHCLGLGKQGRSLSHTLVNEGDDPGLKRPKPVPLECTPAPQDSEPVLFERPPPPQDSKILHCFIPSSAALLHKLFDNTYNDALSFCYDAETDMVTCQNPVALINEIIEHVNNDDDPAKKVGLLFRTLSCACLALYQASKGSEEFKYALDPRDIINCVTHDVASRLAPVRERLGPRLPLPEYTRYQYQIQCISVNEEDWEKVLRDNAFAFSPSGDAAAPLENEALRRTSKAEALQRSGLIRGFTLKETYEDRLQCHVGIRTHGPASQLKGIMYLTLMGTVEALSEVRTPGMTKIDEVERALAIIERCMATIDPIFKLWKFCLEKHPDIAREVLIPTNSRVMEIEPYSQDLALDHHDGTWFLPRHARWYISGTPVEFAGPCAAHCAEAIDDGYEWVTALGINLPKQATDPGSVQIMYFANRDGLVKYKVRLEHMKKLRLCMEMSAYNAFHEGRATLKKRDAAKLEELGCFFD